MQTDEHRDLRRLYPLAGVLAGLLLVVAAAWAAEFIPGDVNDDGVFDIADPAVLRRDLAGLGPGISQEVLCGNGVLDSGEECDSGVICSDLGFAFGELVCGAGCVAEVDTCTNTRFEDLGPTVFDHQTGLEWEKKTDDGSIHDKDNRYNWTAASLGTVPDGTAFTIFLETLNNGVENCDVVPSCVSLNGATITCTPSSGFAGYCDWRLPEITELQTILLEPNPCGTSPCIDQTIFGPTLSDYYWSATSISGSPRSAFVVAFFDGSVLPFGKEGGGLVFPVRAVRSGPPICGDGLLNQASEECDSPNDSACPGACSLDCTCPAPPTCGDGIVNQIGEDCDPPDDSTCPGQCQVDCSCPGPPTGSAEIQAARDAVDGVGLNLSIGNVLVTYLRPQIGGDPAGFFVQAEQIGPALFVRVDPALLTPPLEVGDDVSFTVLEMGTVATLRQATQITALSLSSGGNDVSVLTQDVSFVNLVAALTSYESELITLSGTITSAFSFAGTGFVQALLFTAGVPDNTNLRLRIPSTLPAALSNLTGCTVVLTQTPLQRFNLVAQPHAWLSTEITLPTCPTP